jgi:hypothetical protein
MTADDFGKSSKLVGIAVVDSVVDVFAVVVVNLVLVDVVGIVLVLVDVVGIVLVLVVVVGAVVVTLTQLQVF